jgi:hypothetical protein
MPVVSTNNHVGDHRNEFLFSPIFFIQNADFEVVVRGFDLTALPVRF